MQVITSRQQLSQICASFRQEGQKTGFVPTMGALHEGHISLIAACKEENDVTIASIFVNPTQFNRREDLEQYPRTLQKDLDMLRQAGCDVVFTPDEQEMYSDSPVVQMSFGHLESTMEGANRPGHFNGVGIVVSKLFHAVYPDNAYFGQKDFQQLAIIRRLVEDLGFPIRIHSCPTQREEDGLAMSSRNQRLTPQERKQAPVLYKTLQTTANMIADGMNIQDARKTGMDALSALNVKTEYLEIVHPDTLQPIGNTGELNELCICIAAYFGNVRLIDNILVRID